MPFYNEEKTLLVAISRVLAVKLPIPLELVLVDDGSNDSGPAQLAEVLKDPRVVHLRSAFPGGKGAAVNRGICASRGNILLIQDADLEYSPTDYSWVLQPILEGRCDFVLGSRVLGVGHWGIRRLQGRPLYSLVMNLGSRGLAMLFGLIFHARLTDPTSMMKVFRRECLEGLALQSRGFDWDWELLGKVLRQGRVPLEVPITYQGRAPADGKKLRMWRDGWAALLAILRYRFSPLG